jgi:hypothetical protein
MFKAYRELRIANSDKVALVDADLYAALSRTRWYMRTDLNHYVNIYRTRFHKGKNLTEYLSHVITGAGRGEQVKHINGNALDYQRENLKIVAGSVQRRAVKRCPYRVVIKIDGTLYHVGNWPSLRFAEQARASVVGIARNLRGRGIPRERVQRQLDIAAGRLILRKAA